MTTLNYKGYIGTVDLSEKDELLYGKVEGIDGLVLYEGSCVSELTTAFHKAVDDYIEYCTANNLSPQKSYSGNLNIRINPETHSRLARFASISGISLNALISKSLDNVVATLF